MPTGIKVKEAMVKNVVTGNPNQTALEGSKIMKENKLSSSTKLKDEISICTV